MNGGAGKRKKGSNEKCLKAHKIEIFHPLNKHCNFSLSHSTHSSEARENFRKIGDLPHKQNTHHPSHAHVFFKLVFVKSSHKLFSMGSLTIEKKKDTNFQLFFFFSAQKSFETNVKTFSADKKLIFRILNVL
jgi:hypothetical protein